jgi:hypothetical protein
MALVPGTELIHLQDPKRNKVWHIRATYQALFKRLMVQTLSRHHIGSTEYRSIQQDASNIVDSSISMQGHATQDMSRMDRYKVKVADDV